MNAPAIEVRHLGREREPIAVIDGFSPDPDRLRQFAAGADFIGGDLAYPGVKAELPADYFHETAPLISEVMQAHFGMKKGADVLRATFSIVTTEPHLLTIEQRIPHVDSLEAGRMAILHYLSQDDCDGTAFYRHRSTGFETLDASRGDEYFAALNADLHRCGPPPPAYICGDTPLFEQTGRIEAAYNRAIIYRGRVLHSGAISAGRALSSDPLRGRLTIAAFLEAE